VEITVDFLIKNMNKSYAAHHCKWRSTCAQNNLILNYGTIDGLNANPLITW